MRYRVGTRGSRLALAQTSRVAAALAAAAPGAEFEPEVIRTRGDSDRRPLFEPGRRGLFEAEIDRAVASGEVDFAVHSLKDVPADLPDGLALACVPAREDPSDVLVSPGGRGLGGLPRGASVGTSSLRRAALVRAARPDVEVRPVRGNVETRLGMVGAGLDAVVLARAGLLRLGLSPECAALPTESFVPAPGQGALAVVARAGDAALLRLLSSAEDPGSRAEAEAEMALSREVGSGCRFPVGALARASGARLRVRASASSADGSETVSAGASGPASRPAEVGAAAGRELVARGAGRLAAGWRRGLEEWGGGARLG